MTGVTMLEQEAKGCSIDYGDTAWVLVATLLVLAMMPALAFFEAGLLRSKNTLSIITQILAGMCCLSCLWFLCGYSLVFGTDLGGVIGGLDHLVFIDTSFFDCGRFSPNIPAASFALFYMMFAAITPLLMTGAYAERMSWKGSLWLTILFEIFVFYPVAHQLWGGGWLARIGAVDFAGGIVIHTTAGAGSLVCALYLGKRADFDEYHGEAPPSNLPLAAIGAALLWAGWYGFNGGSALSANGVAVSAVVSTQIACSMAAVAWLICSVIKDGRPSSVGIMNGALAGLAGVTPASGYIDAQSSIVLGIILGVAAFFGCHIMKGKFHIDDALDVSSVHGLTGVIGSIANGFVARQSLNPAGPNGLFYGNPRLLAVQLLAVAYAAAYAAIVTAILLVILDKILGGIRHDEMHQSVGLDWVEHREVAYHDLHVLDEDNPVRGLPQFAHSLPQNTEYRRRAARSTREDDPLLQDARHSMM